MIAREVRDLTRQMCRENPGWGAPLIQGELLELGIDIGESSVGNTWCGPQAAVTDLETEGGHDEEIDGDQLREVMVEKGAPGERRLG